MPSWKVLITLSLSLSFTHTPLVLRSIHTEMYIYGRGCVYVWTRSPMCLCARKARTAPRPRFEREIRKSLKLQKQVTWRPVSAWELDAPRNTSRVHSQAASQLWQAINGDTWADPTLGELFPRWLITMSPEGKSAFWGTCRQCGSCSQPACFVLPILVNSWTISPCKVNNVFIVVWNCTKVD